MGSCFVFTQSQPGYDGVKGGAVTDTKILFLKWGNPAAFYYLILIAVFVAIYVLFERHFSQRLDNAFGKKVTAYLTQSLSLSKRRMQIVLQTLGLLFILIALARPQAGESQRVPKVTDADVRLRVALAREGEHSVRSGLDAAVDHARVMHA